MMKIFKIAFKAGLRLVCFGLMFLLSVVAFNLFYLNEKLQMLRVVNEFHHAQISDDKTAINNLLTDDFVETGVRRFVQTPEAIYKKDLLKWDYSKFSLSIEAKYSLFLSMLSSNSQSLTFVKKITVNSEDGKKYPPIYFCVTYSFEETADGLKIKKAVRNL